MLSRLTDMHRKDHKCYFCVFFFVVVVERFFKTVSLVNLKTHNQFWDRGKNLLQFSLWRQQK